jgi:hypothetical protein
MAIARDELEEELIESKTSKPGWSNGRQDRKNRNKMTI